MSPRKCLLGWDARRKAGATCVADLTPRCPCCRWAHRGNLRMCSGATQHLRRGMVPWGKLQGSAASGARSGHLSQANYPARGWRSAPPKKRKRQFAFALLACGRRIRRRCGRRIGCRLPCASARKAFEHRFDRITCLLYPSPHRAAARTLASGGSGFPDRETPADRPRGPAPRTADRNL